MTVPSLTNLPAAPQRTDAPATFVTKADAFLGAVVTFQTEMNASVTAFNADFTTVNSNATAAQTAETNAVAASTAADNASNATLWVSGTSYSAGDVVYSPIDYQSYRANTAYSGTTDPSASSDWVQVSGYNESHVTITSSGNASTVDLNTGYSFSEVLSEATTFTFSNAPASGQAQAFILKIVQDSGGSGYAVTWPASVDWGLATAPTLTAGADAVDVFVFYTHDGGTTYYGFTSGQAMG